MEAGKPARCRPDPLRTIRLRLELRRGLPSGPGEPGRRLGGRRAGRRRPHGDGDPARAGLPAVDRRRQPSRLRPGAGTGHLTRALRPARRPLGAARRPGARGDLAARVLPGSGNGSGGGPGARESRRRRARPDGGGLRPRRADEFLFDDVQAAGGLRSRLRSRLPLSGGRGLHRVAGRRRRDEHGAQGRLHRLGPARRRHHGRLHGLPPPERREHVRAGRGGAARRRRTRRRRAPGSALRPSGRPRRGPRTDRGAQGDRGAHRLDPVALSRHVRGTGDHGGDGRPGGLPPPDERAPAPRPALPGQPGRSRPPGPGPRRGSAAERARRHGFLLVHAGANRPDQRRRSPARGRWGPGPPTSSSPAGSNAIPTPAGPVDPARTDVLAPERSRTSGTERSQAAQQHSAGGGGRAVRGGGGGAREHPGHGSGRALRHLPGSRSGRRARRRARWNDHHCGCRGRRERTHRHRQQRRPRLGSLRAGQGRRRVGHGGHRIRRPRGLPPSATIAAPHRRPTSRSHCQWGNPPSWGSTSATR